MTQETHANLATTRRGALAGFGLAGLAVKDGSVVAGRAPSPLPVQPIKVSGGNISLV